MINLTKTQRAALLFRAGFAPRTIQTNHQINAERTLVAKGLMVSTYVNNRLNQYVTEAGRVMAMQIKQEVAS